MVKYCVGVLCPNESGGNVKLNPFPKDEKIRLEWIKNAVLQNRLSKDAGVCDVSFIFLLIFFFVIINNIIIQKTHFRNTFLQTCGKKLDQKEKRN